VIPPEGILAWTMGQNPHIVCAYFNPKEDKIPQRLQVLLSVFGYCFYMMKLKVSSMQIAVNDHLFMPKHAESTVMESKAARLFYKRIYNGYALQIPSASVSIMEGL